MVDLVRPETKFFPALNAIKACLCEDLESGGAGKLCFCGIVPAGQPPIGVLDCAKKQCGVAWVAPGAVFPSATFPEPLESGLIPCNSPLAMTITVGVARCHPTPKLLQGQADVQAYFEATELYLADMMAIRRALLCCTRQNPELQVSLGTWEPIEPAGGISGGVWTATIG